MRDSTDTVLYVGKAKNLRNRLSSYRVANPDRRPRRQIRLLHAVARIDIEETCDERSALARESQLLRTLRPRFNRAGTWSAPPKVLTCAAENHGVELAVVPLATTDRPASLPLGAMAKPARNALARLIWIALNPREGFARLPVGWLQGTASDSLFIAVNPLSRTDCGEISRQITGLFEGKREAFQSWISGRIGEGRSPFEKAVLDGDLEFLELFTPAESAQPSQAQNIIP
jgi:hypothetical protein